MHRLIYLVLALVSLSVVASCIDRPEIVLDEPQLVDVLVDVHRAEGLLEMQQMHGSSMDENERYQREVIAAVLQKHGVTRAQYDSSLMWYAQHLKLLTRVYGHVDERLREEHEMWSLQATEQRDFATSEAGDSVELWTMRSHLTLDSRRFSEFRYWEYPSDSNFIDGDTLHWHFCVKQLLPGQQVIASISLTEKKLSAEEIRRSRGKEKELTGASLGYCQQVITQNGSYMLSATTDSVQPFGSAVLSLLFLYDTIHVSPVFIDSLSLLRTHVNFDE